MIKKKILFVVDNLVMGGVTRVLVNLLKVVSESYAEIDLLVLHRHSDMEIELPERVNILQSGERLSYVDTPMGELLKQKSVGKIVSKVLFSLKIKLGLIKYTVIKDRKESLKKHYDVEIAFGDGFPYIYAFYGNSSKKVAWMHSDVMVRDYSERYYNRIKTVLKGYDECVAVSGKVAESYKEKYGVSSISVIHNLMDVSEIVGKSFDEKEVVPYETGIMNFVSVGRLDYSKNYPMLLETAKKLTDEGFDFRVYIVGDGADKEELEKLVIEYGMSECFILLGRKNNPYPYIKNADCFLLSSRYEGLPTVVIEALILGVPCVSTRVAGIEQLLNEDLGIITENDKTSFCNGVRKILENKELLQEYKNNVAYYAYDNDSIKEKIWKVLQ